jgi:FkbH-like protein
MMTSLQYPLDVNYILRKRKFIKRELLKNKPVYSKNIAILGGSSTNEIKNILELFLLKNSIKPIFYESEYNKFYEDALFSDELRNFDPDVVYIHITNVNIINYPQLGDDEDKVDELLGLELDKYKSIWSALSRYNCSIIQNNFDLPFYRSLGNLDGYDAHGKTYYINKLNIKFAEQAQEMSNLYINDINYLSSYVGLKEWFDPSLWFQAKYAISMSAIPELAFNISKIVNSIMGGAKKCLVLDLDNTCWGGVIGDDGLSGINIGTETAVSEAFYSFQKYIKELKDRGVTLAVCSKNYYENAKEGFDHPDSVLKFDDFTSFKANWNHKSKNIIDISKEINIDVSSLVFIDDNPVERDIVLSQIQNINVPDIGSNITNFIKYIDRGGYFEPITLSNDDIDRNKHYKENKKRLMEVVRFESYNDFLVSLSMIAEVKFFSSIYLDRIAQLINKTNQFNLTTKRYTVGEIVKISSSDKHVKIYGKLKDKYGDNGLISVIIGTLDKEFCHIDLWIMSCRVFKRDMELVMLDELVRRCLELNVTEIIGYYYISPKNNIVKDLYKKLGFTLEYLGDNPVWRLNIINYKMKNTLISVQV